MATAIFMSSKPAVDHEAGFSFGGKMTRGAKGFFCSSSSSSSSSSSRPCTLSSHDSANEFAAPEPWTDNADNRMALQLLQRSLANTPHGCPDKPTLQWFLRDSNFTVDAAEAKLKAMLTWRATNRLFGLRYADIAAQHQTGKAYLHCSLDRAGRPTVVIRARKHLIGQFPITDSKRLCAYMIDSALDMLQQQQQQHPKQQQALAGCPQQQQQDHHQQKDQQQQQQQEQILWLVDLQGISMSNIDLAFVMFVLQAVPECYPRRVGQVLLVDAPWIFKAPWEAFKPLLRKYAALVRFVSRKELAAEYFTADSLPPDFKS